MVEVAVLAHALGVVQLVSVLALCSHRDPSVEMVAVVAHALGVVLQICMGTPCYFFHFSLPLFWPSLRSFLSRRFNICLLVIHLRASSLLGASSLGLGGFVGHLVVKSEVLS